MDAIIVDMDGTLCDVSSIRSLLPNFHAFHTESINCPPNMQVVNRVRQESAAGRTIIVVTARKAAFRNVTAFFLAMHNVPSDLLIMRRNDDNRPDYNVKADILNQIRAAGFNPVLAIDDNPNVVQLWRENNIPTIVVPGWTG